MANGAWTIRRHRRRPSPSGEVSRPEKWNHAASSSASTDSPSRIVVKPNLHSGNWFDHGTPKFETYHQPFTVANDSAITNSTAAANIARLRRDRMATAVTATAASAPSEPASPANTPKWCVHLVGVNIIARNEMMVMPMMRRLGPAAVPGILPLAQRHCDRDRQRQQQRQHREAAGDRAVRAGGEQPLVADVLVEPGSGWARRRT